MEELKDLSVSIIIAAYNKPNELLNTINSIMLGSIVPNQIVVSDQSNNDETERIIIPILTSKYGNRIKYFKTNRRGLTANRNDALSAANGDFIASVDDDVTVDKKWLELMLKEWIANWNKAHVLITGRILPDPDFKEDSMVTALRAGNERIIYAGKAKPMGVLIGAQFGACRELFEALGPKPFDEKLGVGTIDFPGADDDEFAYRVQKKGFAIVYEPSIFVIHHTERVNNWRKMRYSRAIGNGAALAKHFLKGDLLLFFELVKIMVINFGKGLKAILKRQEPEGTSRLLSCAGLVVGFNKWIYYAMFSKSKT